MMRAFSMTRALAVFARQRGCRFTVEGQAEAAILVMSPEVFLPVVALHADHAARTLLAQPLQIEFREDPMALLGVYANVPPLTGDEQSALRAAFFFHAARQIFGIDENVTIECGPVYRAYENGLLAHVQKTGTITWPMAAVSLR
jgi:hypothetical protein